ncbi:uncharacterized protein LOC127839320 isoform X2 [Dreissena polymorpha]|uniref:uncharacterized protein LOC127839320 isoform X2 n=1 Tax=Dreissena polymorpha TaxID=45954 RepID=UPI002264C740|nr:uncharacterized protein LOC127839320 isoform X2 [Dreissena polymorpha]XP_052223583.1 uncharacterized protein LOC127839320 isoform X2 [Dreissena polymorpha]
MRKGVNMWLKKVTSPISLISRKPATPETSKMLTTLVILFILALRGTFCHVVLSLKTDQANTTIQCSSNSDIIFKFTKDKTNATVTIAECETTLKTCYLVDNYHAVNYATSFTDDGGLLNVLNIGEDTYGTYTCYETYNLGSYKRTELKPPVKVKTKPVTAEPVCRNCPEYSTGSAAMCLNAVVVVLTSLHLMLYCVEKRKRVSRVLRRRFTCFSQKSSFNESIQLDEMESAEMRFPLMHYPIRRDFEATVPVYHVREGWNSVCYPYHTRPGFEMGRRYSRSLFREDLDLDLRQSLFQDNA